jgi:glutamate mutase epsilon subunit
LYLDVWIWLENWQLTAEFSSGPLFRMGNYGGVNHEARVQSAVAAAVLITHGQPDARALLPRMLFPSIARSVSLKKRVIIR